MRLTGLRVGGLYGFLVFRLGRLVCVWLVYLVVSVLFCGLWALCWFGVVGWVVCWYFVFVGVCGFASL